VPSSSKETSVEKDKNVILYQGNLNPGRGLELAIATMTFLPEFKLKIIGGGHEMSRLKDLAEKLKVTSQVEFIGRVKFQNLKAHTDRAVIGLLLEEPLGLSFEYSLPNKLFDYIHSNTIVLATPLIEVKKIISKYPVGEILKDRNPKKMAQQIRDIISNRKNFQFSDAKRDLNWQKESLVLQKVFSPYSKVKK
jgi:glycosyltransferase involved in cell wall biosynthesis